MVRLKRVHGWLKSSLCINMGVFLQSAALSGKAGHRDIALTFRNPLRLLHVRNKGAISTAHVPGNAGAVTVARIS
jgi:hypothetical protein